MKVIFLEDAKTGIEYKATVEEVLKAFDYGFSGREYRKYFEVTIYEPKYKILWFQFYRKVRTKYRMVEDVDLVSDYVLEIFKNYLEDIVTFRKEMQLARLTQETKKREIEEKYDSLPHKITVE